MTGGSPPAPGRCNGCTLCCSVPSIVELDKPAYRPCRHIVADGCAVHDRPERPGVCRGFVCRYILAHATGSAERLTLPHPNIAGAFVFVPPNGASANGKTVVLCIDPENPRLWPATGLPAYLHAALDSGLTVRVHDRGYDFSIATHPHLAAVVAEDYTAVAAALGIPPNLPGYAGTT